MLVSSSFLILQAKYTTEGRFGLHIGKRDFGATTCFNSGVKPNSFLHCKQPESDFLHRSPSLTAVIPITEEGALTGRE